MALPKIDTPVYETKLISTGKKVRFRPFLVKEQKLFLMASQSDDAQEVVNTIKQVLRNCILDDVDIDMLPMFDLEHVFLQLRARSVGEVVNLKYNCNNDVPDKEGTGTTKCTGVVKVDINLLEIEPVKGEGHSNKIELTDKMGIVMKYPSFSVLEKVKIDNEADLFQLVIACIDFIYDEDQLYYAKDTTIEELTEFVENMQQADVAKIQNFFASMPKLEKKFDFVCPKCGYKENISIEGIQNFFE